MSSCSLARNPVEGWTRQRPDVRQTATAVRESRHDNMFHWLWPRDPRTQNGCRPTFTSQLSPSTKKRFVPKSFFSVAADQWRRSALKSGWAQGAWGMEVPQRGPGAGQKPDIYGQFAAGKCFSAQVCCRSPSSISPTPKKKEKYRSARIPCPNAAGTRAHPWLRYTATDHSVYFSVWSMWYASVSHYCIGLSRYIAITNLSITAVFIEYLLQFLIDLNQIYRHSSVPKTRLRDFFSFLPQAVSEHGAAATFFVNLCLSRCSESLDCLTLA